MRLVLCCFCAARPEEQDVLDSTQDINSPPTSRSTPTSKGQAAAAQEEDDGPGTATVSPTQQPGTDEDAQTQRNSGRLAKHLLDRQPSKINRAKLQSSSFGGLTGQRWISHSDGLPVEGSTHNGHAHVVPLLQEVKPLHDPISGPAPSRFGTPSGGFGHTGHVFGSVGNSSTAFARSVNRLSAINGSGVGSRRASLLDFDLTKASLQFAIGSTLLRSSMAGNAPHAVHHPEPWMLHHIFRSPPPVVHAHSQPLLSYGGPAGAMSGANGAAPSPNSVWASVAANLGGMHTGDREPRECTASSLGPMNYNSPMTSHAQHPLTPHHSTYPVPLITKTHCDRAAGLPNPVVILLVQPSAADPTAAAGNAAWERPSTGGTGPAEAAGKMRSADGATFLDGQAVVANMYLDLPRTGRRGAAGNANASQAQPLPDAAGDNDVRRAHVALVAALQGLSGRHVDLVHVWHNKAAAAMMSQAASSAASPAGIVASAIASAATDVGSDSAGGRLHAAATAALAGGDAAVVLWGLRELLDEDPCLPFLAKDLLRQAALRPEHVPPCTHALAPSTYGALLPGREPLSAPAIGAVLGTGHQSTLGATTLQAAMQHGHVRVHVCAYQTLAPAVSPSSVSTTPASLVGPIAAAAGPAEAAPPTSVWLPAVVLEWPQALMQNNHAGPLPPPVGAGWSYSSLAINLHSATPLPHGIVSSAQLRVPHDADGRMTSTAQLTDLSPLAMLTGASLPGPANLFGNLVPTRFTGAGDTPGFGSVGSVQPAMPSLTLGMGGNLGMGGVSGALLTTSVPPSEMSPTPVAAATTPELRAGVRGCGYTGAAAGAGAELEPLAGAELMYVIQTWQRHHLLLASVPYAITLFDCGGRVLQQNQGSVEFMGENTREANDHHNHHPPNTTTGVTNTGGGGSEARESVASMAKAEATGRTSGTANGPGAGVPRSSGGLTATVEASDVDVLSVLFCLCPDLLDEMLEEVICGNMWRSIVQVPRVMRPCIRAAQRWVAARTSATAKQPSQTAEATASMAPTVGNGSTIAPTHMPSDDHDGGGSKPKAAATSLAAAVAAAAAGGPYSGSRPAPVVPSSPAVHHGAASRAGPVGQQPSPRSPRCAPGPASLATNTDMHVDPEAVAGNGEALGPSVNPAVSPMRPATAASPLRKLATSLALMTTNSLPSADIFPRATAAHAGGEPQAGHVPMPSFPAACSSGALRRPPARTYSLRGLVGPMSRSFTQPPRSRHSRLNRGGSGEAAETATLGGLTIPVVASAAPAPLRDTASVIEKYRAGVGKVARGERPEGVGAPMRRFAPNANDDNSDPMGAIHDAAAFRSFTVGMAKRAVSTALPIPAGRTRSMGATMLVRPPYSLQPESSQQQQQQQPSAALLLLQQQLPKLPGPAPNASSGFAAPAKPRSAVLAFAERLRSGRNSGGGLVGGATAADGGGAASPVPPHIRSVPKRLRSSLSMVSGPGQPPLDPVESDQEVPPEEGTATDGAPLPVALSPNCQAGPGSPGEVSIMAPAGEADVEAETPRFFTHGAEVCCLDEEAPGSLGPEVLMSLGSKPQQPETESIIPGPGLGQEGGVRSSEAAVSRVPVAPMAVRNGALEQGDVCSTEQQIRQLEKLSEEQAAHSYLQVWPNGLQERQLPSPLATQQDDNTQRAPSNSSAIQASPFSFSTVIADAADGTVATRSSAPGASPTHRTAIPTQSKDVFGNRPPRSSLDPITTADSRVDEAVSDASLAIPVDLRPHRSVPLEKIESSLGNSDTDTDPWVVRGSAPSRPGLNPGYYSTSGVGGTSTGTSGTHARGGVRRQMHAFKRPLSRSSTRSYLMTALQTSTLTVLGRVQSQREMEYRDDSDEDLSIGRNQGNEGDGAPAEAPSHRRDLRAMSQGMSALARKRVSSTHQSRNDVRRSNSSSFNVSAVEPRMAVPRIFSFMRSASRRLLEQKQQQQQQQAAAAAAADGGSAAAAGPKCAGRSPPERLCSAEVDADLARGSGSAGGICRGPLYSSSPQCSVEQRTTPSTHTGRSALDTNSMPASRASASGNVQAQAAGRTSRISAAGLTPQSSASHAGGGGGAFASPVSSEVSAAGAMPSGGYGEPSPGGLMSGLHPQLSRVRSVDGVEAARMVSPRDMSPADMARRVGMAWHEVAATSFTDPVTGARVVALVQNDVSEKVETEMQLTELMEVEHRLLEQIFPRHVLEHIAMQNISAAVHSSGNNLVGMGSAGGGSGRKQRRKSQFDLLKSQDCSQLAHHHEQITILFCDVKGFTAMCSSVEPAVVMSFLNMLYTQFDSLLHMHDVYKVETIGDCYMVAGGLVRRGPDGVAALLEPGEVDEDHARKVVRFAKDLLEVVREMQMPNGQALQVRVGIHSGPAMSGVVGTKMPRFCLFGDTINTASRCESTCPAGVIQVTTAVRDLVPEEQWVATEGVVAKGKGMLRTFILGPVNWAPAATSEGAEELITSGLVHPRPSSLAVLSDGGLASGGSGVVANPVTDPSPSPPTIAMASKAMSAANAADRLKQQQASGSFSGVATLANIIAAGASNTAMSATANLVRTPAGHPSMGPQQSAAATNSCYLRLSSTNLAYGGMDPTSSTMSAGVVRRFAPAGELPHIEPRPPSLARPRFEEDEGSAVPRVPEMHELRVLNFRAGSTGGGSVAPGMGGCGMTVGGLNASAAVDPELLNGAEMLGLEEIGALEPVGTTDTRQHNFLLSGLAAPVTAPLHGSESWVPGGVLLPYGSKSEPSPAYGGANDASV